MRISWVVGLLWISAACESASAGNGANAATVAPDADLNSDGKIQEQTGSNSPGDVVEVRFINYRQECITHQPQIF